jgi:uncharacterized protein (DUF2126 family)
MKNSPPELEESVARIDRIIAEAGMAVWIGAEPTFTDRRSEAPEWLNEALGADKERRARQLLELLRERQPGAVVLRTVGRQYAGEPRPRWGYGLYARRDGQPVWRGPPDDLGGAAPAVAPLAALHAALIAALCARGWIAANAGDFGDGTLRLVFRVDGQPSVALAAGDVRLGRPSIHDAPIPDTGAQDELAALGDQLVVLGMAQNQASVELPAFASVPQFLDFLSLLADAATSAGVSHLTLRGFPPPVDASVALMTLTPDPAVLEVNQAPAADIRSFLDHNRQLFALATEVGLAPFRLHYNGTVTDSGGGGQLTIGGPTPAASPFFVTPQLLPRLVRYLLRHPSLSYWFATSYIGGSSQSPRPDEGLGDALEELALALEQLARIEAPAPDLLWGTLRHFLADCSGNPHRAELNIEKLYNPYLPGRGRLGLAEFRAFRMAASAERLAAVALLVRALCAMLAKSDVVPELTRWGSALHDRFALPSQLRGDLRQVLDDLARAGLALGPSIEAELLADPDRHMGTLELASCRLEVERAFEFWPLVGDVASQESVSSRLVDSSSARIEVRLSSTRGALEAQDCDVLVNGYRLPLVPVRTPDFDGYAFGVRYRSFVPAIGLHPSIASCSCLVLDLIDRRSGERARGSAYAWRPDGGAYPGLPTSAEDAALRRAERFVVTPLAEHESTTGRTPPSGALTPFCFDLRRV